MMKLLVTTAPPFPVWPEWEIVAPKEPAEK
jgi:hypothetical protein